MYFRAKTARVITFEQFSQALSELAPKRFKGKGQEETLQQLYGLIAGKEPSNAGVTVSVYLSAAHCLIILQSQREKECVCVSVCVLCVCICVRGG